MEKVGCTPPFVKSLDNICNNQESAKKAMEIYKQENVNSSCLYPCHYLSNFDISTISWESHTNREFGIFFKRFVQMNASKCTFSGLDLFAAVGGYIGLFLGVSIFNLRDGVAFIIRRMNN